MQTARRRRRRRRRKRRDKDGNTRHIEVSKDGLCKVGIDAGMERGERRHNQMKEGRGMGTKEIQKRIE